MAPLDIPDNDELPEESDLCPTIVLTREEKALKHLILALVVVQLA